MTKRSLPNVSRRSFLQTASAAGAGTLLIANTAQARPSEAKFPQRVLGRTGRKVSTLALGTWPCGKSSDVDIPAVEQLVDESLKLGINFVDAANVYGKAEEAIGIALEGRRS